VFLNIGKFYGKNDGTTGEQAREFFTLPSGFIRQHLAATSSWQKVRLRNLQIEPFKNEAGFQLIAKALGVNPPVKDQNPGTADAIP
jgi:hypothetical protein